MEEVMRRVAILMVAGVGIGWMLTLALKEGDGLGGRDACRPRRCAVGGSDCGMIAVGVLVSVAPARRAATIDPMQALRNE